MRKSVLDEKVSHVLHLSGKTTFQTHNGHRSNNEYGAPAMRDFNGKRKIDRNHASTSTVRSPRVATLFGESHKLQAINLPPPYGNV